MSSNSEPNPDRPSNLPQGRWSHLNEYEQQLVREAIAAYDEIVRMTDDIPQIASRYQVTVEDVLRAKDYAFGSGVSTLSIFPMRIWQRPGIGWHQDEVMTLTKCC